MMRPLLSLFLLAAVLVAAVPAAADDEAVAPPRLSWPEAGPFGRIDQAQARRGFQVYREICSACHALSLVSYRNLAGIGLGEDEIKTIAGQYQIQDGPTDQGDMVMRPARPSDRFVRTFPNDQAARAANNGALPPDLSVIIKARPGGEDYVAALLTGFADPPPGFALPEGKFYNRFFPGHTLAMPPLLVDDGMAYTDGTKPTAAQQARDVAVFLSYVAEPSQDERKALGLKVVLFLAVFAGLLYACQRRIWSRLPRNVAGR